MNLIFSVKFRFGAILGKISITIGLKNYGVYLGMTLPKNQENYFFNPPENPPESLYFWRIPWFEILESPSLSIVTPDCDHTLSEGSFQQGCNR